MSIEGLTYQHQRALLVLADGSVFSGIAVGATGTAVGEVVFNTAMTGYQEILTDPSYAEQMVTLTYPHIGNVGVNSQDCESEKVWAAALIIRELSPVVSNWRSESSLEDYLVKNNVVAISDIDTRRLTRILREKGAQHGCIMAGVVDEKEALALAKAYPGIQGKDLATVVTTSRIYQWEKGTIDLDRGERKLEKAEHHVVVYDFGVKQQIMRLLVDRGCRLTVVPAQTPASEVLALNPDGVFLSNGPGDPAACEYAIQNIKILLEKNLPLFGICLGFQLMALACGAKTVKMKFGHHGANHPVEDADEKRVHITSQNHSFAVDDKSLPSQFKITHRSLFDGSLQGIAHTTKPAFAFQGHPEASPGPHDIVELFDRFIVMLQERKVSRNTHAET